MCVCVCQPNCTVVLTYRKLVSTERRALVILLQRPGSVVLSSLSDSELSGNSPFAPLSMGVGMCDGKGRSASTSMRERE